MKELLLPGTLPGLLTLGCLVTNDLDAHDAPITMYAGKQRGSPAWAPGTLKLYAAKEAGTGHAILYVSSGWATIEMEKVFLDLRHAANRDRAARWLAGRMGWEESTCTAPRWGLDLSCRFWELSSAQNRVLFFSASVGADKERPCPPFGPGTIHVSDASFGPDLDPRVALQLACLEMGARKPGEGV